MSYNFANRTRIAAILAAGTLVVSQQAGAAAFALKEQSVTYLGTDFSGTASSSRDASSNWYNTAGLTQLNNDQVLFAATYINPHSKLYNATATKQSGAVVPGVTPSEGGANGLVPGFHAAMKINPRLVLGFSVIAPFGLSTKYDATSIARYVATKSTLQTIDYSPGIAFKINDQFSIGAAFDAMYIKGILDNDVFGGVIEGYLNNQASGWSYGYHLGVLYSPTKCTKMGLAYFSAMSPRLSGDVAARGVALVNPTTVTGRINLPDRFVYSITHQYSDKWTVAGDIEWTHWSRLKWLRFNYNTGLKGIEYFYYKNTFRFALGTDYNYSKCLTFKGGLGYEQTPVTNTYRSARLPDANRYSFALGVKYAVNRNISLDAGYAYLFAKSVPIQFRSGLRTLFGNYKNSANIVGAQLTWNFV